MRSITQAQVHEVSDSAKFAEKKGLAFKPSHSSLVEGIFLFPVILKRKLTFENVKRVYKVLEGCSVKEKRSFHSKVLRMRRCYSALSVNSV